MLLEMLEYADLYTLRCTCKQVAELFFSWNNTRLLQDWTCNIKTGATVPQYNLNLMKAGQRLVTAHVNSQAAILAAPGHTPWMNYKDKEIMNASEIAKQYPDGAIIIQRDYKKSPGKVVKNFQITLVHAYLTRKLAKGRKERTRCPRKGQDDNHLYHNIEDGMLLKPILDIDGKVAETGFQNSQDLKFRNCVATICDKLCEYLSLHCNSSKQHLLRWTSVHFSAGSKASCHIHILSGAFSQDVGSLRAHMKHFWSTLGGKEQLITDWNGSVRVGAFRDTGMAKLPLNDQELRYLNDHPDPELSGCHSINLYQHCIIAYELLIVPTLVCPRDAALGNMIHPLQPSCTQLCAAPSLKPTRTQRASDSDRGRSQAFTWFTADLSAWVKSMVFSAFGRPILAGWNLQSQGPLHAQTRDGKIVFTFKAQQGTSCRFKQERHGSQGNVNYLVLHPTGSMYLKCFSPKCSARFKAVHGKYRVYQRLLSAYSEAHKNDAS